MKSDFSLSHKATAVKAGKAHLPSRFTPKGFFTFEVYDKKTGVLKERRIVLNGITDVGKDHALDSTFDAAAQITTWYLGMVDDSGFSAFDATDTMASHAGWVEFTAYDEATRPEWAPDAASGQAITNGTARDFTISGGGTLHGLFVNSINTKGGTTGTLWATAAFTSPVPVSASDLIKLTYTITT